MKPSRALTEDIVDLYGETGQYLAYERRAHWVDLHRHQLGFAAGSNLNGLAFRVDEPQLGAVS